MGEMIKEYKSILYEVKDKRLECQHIMVESITKVQLKENAVHFRFSVYIFVQINL